MYASKYHNCLDFTVAIAGDHKLTSKCIMALLDYLHGEIKEIQAKGLLPCTVLLFDGQLVKRHVY